MLASRSRAAADASSHVYARRGSRHTVSQGLGNITAITAADIVELEQRAKKSSQGHFNWENYQDVIPLVACLLWIFWGTVFYSVHDEFGWVCKVLLSMKCNVISSCITASWSLYECEYWLVNWMGNPGS